MRGFHSLVISQNTFDFAEHLIVLEEVLRDRARWTRSDAGAAALAERFVDDGLLLRFVEGNGRVGTESDAGFAAGAFLLKDVGRVRLLLDVTSVDQHHRLGSGGPGLGARGWVVA